MTSRIRVDDDVSVARNVDFPLTQVKCAPVEAERSRTGPGETVIAPHLPERHGKPENTGETASGRRNRS
ncbi:hypothetical protein [Burkholderia pyrrocinia]|uniref:hypothetical protein n=1 Tax=Burkholderia pyrrocinia TaxID=60550 RepID=UPI00191C1A58|nr:hypothetical protein [Burkholderia pyrrocinia]